MALKWIPQGGLGTVPKNTYFLVQYEDDPAIDPLQTVYQVSHVNNHDVFISRVIINEYINGTATGKILNHDQPPRANLDAPPSETTISLNPQQRFSLEEGRWGYMFRFI